MLEPSFPICFWSIVSNLKLYLEGCLDIAFLSCFQTLAGISFTALSKLCCPRASVLRNSGFCFILRLWEFSSQREDFSCLNRGSHVSEVPLNRITRSLTMAQSGFVDARDAVSVWMIKKDDLILSQLVSASSSIMFAIGVKTTNACSNFELRLFFFSWESSNL